MAHIICRYTVPHCWVTGEFVNHTPTFWFCDSNSECPTGQYQKPDDAKPNCINPQCKHLQYLHFEFEKNVREYKYETIDFGNYAYFETGKIALTSDDIEYLEIDKRVLVKDYEIVTHVTNICDIV